MTNYVVQHAAVNVFDPAFPKDEAIRRHLTRRLRKGQTVSSDEELKYVDIDRLLDLGSIREADKPDEDTPDGDVEAEEQPDYDAMSYPDLQKLAKARELSAGGTAAEIAQRLKEQDAEKAEEVAAQQRLADMQGGGGSGADPTGQGNGGLQYVQQQ